MCYQGKFVEGIKAMRTAVTLMEECYDSRHPDLAGGYRALATALWEQYSDGKQDKECLGEMEALLLRTWKILREVSQEVFRS